MSRSGYTDDADDYDQHMVNLWRGAVASAKRGKRGQKFFRDLVAALDAMPVKELHAEVFDDPNGKVCALGALARVKGVDTTKFDPEDDYAAKVLAKKFDVSDKLTRETIYWNDEGGPRGRTIQLSFSRLHGVYWAHIEESPHDRWQRMRNWAAKQIKVETPHEQ